MWFVVLLLSLCVRGRATAQSGVRVHLYNAFIVANEPRQLGIVLGLGYDHDLSRSLAFGIDADYVVGAFRDDDERDGHAYQLNYRAYYLTGNPGGSSFYIGSRLGLRRYSFYEDVTWSCPVGLRIGVRGGLEKFFADLFLELGAQAGGTTPSGASLSGPEAHIGVDIGFGWRRRDR